MIRLLFAALCLASLLILAPPALLAAAPAPTVVVAANAAVHGLDPERGQRYLRLAPLDDGRVIALYTLGYPVQCGLLKPCRQPTEVWHLVFDRRGIVVPPSRTTPDLDVLPGLNSGSISSGKGETYADGGTAVFGLGHSSHNGGGGYFVRLDRAGHVLGREGGTGSYSGGRICVLGRDVIVSNMWVDPVTQGYQWYENGTTLAATVNLGGYGYNYDTHQELACGPSAALGGNFGLLVRKQAQSHVGFSLYRAPGKRWSMVGTEVRLPVARLPLARYLAAGGLAVADDRGVVMFRDSTIEGRMNMFYARFRITAKGIVLVDATPRPMPSSPDYEGIDGNLINGANGRFYAVLYQAGDSAPGRPHNRRQVVRIFGLDFDSGALQDIVPAYEDDHWSGNPPLSYYAESLNQEAFSLARSCDGNLYVGGAIDGGKGTSVMRIFSVPVGSNTCR